MEYWKFRALDKLKAYNLQKTALVSIPEEIAMLESEAYSIRSATADGTPVQGGGSAREDRLLSNMVTREELQRMYDRAQRAVSIVDRGLQALTYDERHILEVMYINQERGCLYRLMEEYNLAEESSMYKKANKALLRFTIAMYGATEN